MDATDRTDLSRVVALLRRDRKQFLILALVLAGLGLPLATGIARMPPGVDPTVALFLRTAGSFLLLLASIQLARAARLLFLHRAPLVRLLAERPGEVVWVYAERRRSGESQDHELLVHDRERRVHRLRVPERELPALVARLERRLPRATFGWSRHHAVRYAMHPDALLARA